MEAVEFDANGNVASHSQLAGGSRRMVWDELTYPVTFAYGFGDQRGECPVDIR
ncbi:MAG: hypothetical protein KA479_11080 [Saprospiraceae bacterium]|nr:hypothetical protein [Saprospiraceae bacterium]